MTSDFDPSTLESIHKDLNDILVWLQNVADIPPETKLSKDGNGFALFPATLRSWFYRTFFTNDSGKTHTTDFITQYDKIDCKLRECMNLSFSIDRDYYLHINRLLGLSKKGLTNFMNHHDYRNNTYITGNIKNLCKFVIPKQIRLINDYLEGQRYMVLRAPVAASSAPINIPTLPPAAQFAAFSHTSNDLNLSNTPSPQNPLFLSTTPE